MLAKSLFRLVTQPLILAGAAAILIAEMINTKTDKEVAVLSVFFLVGILPNLLIQLLSFWRSGKELEPNDHIFAYDVSRETLYNKGDRDTRNRQIHIHRWYVFWFSLLAVVYGSQLFAHAGWMIIAMAYAIYHGINLLIVKYFSGINPRVGEIVFWSTVLININPKLAFLYILLLPVIWWHPNEKKLDFVALNWSIGIGLFSALLTWIS